MILRGWRPNLETLSPKPRCIWPRQNSIWRFSIVQHYTFDSLRSVTYRGSGGLATSCGVAAFLMHSDNDSPVTWAWRDRRLGKASLQGMSGSDRWANMTLVEILASMSSNDHFCSTSLFANFYPFLFYCFQTCSCLCHLVHLFLKFELFIRIFHEDYWGPLANILSRIWKSIQQFRQTWTRSSCLH